MTPETMTTTAFPRRPDRPAEVERRVKAFYESYPFPGYQPDDWNGYLAAMDHLYRALGFGPQLAGAVVLDAGCGSGEHTVYAAGYRPRQIIGLDLSLASLRTAQARCHREEVAPVRLVSGSIRALPLRPASVDVVICCGVLHHMEDPWEGLRVLTAALKPGGWLLFFVYDAAAHGVVRWERRLLTLLCGRDPQRRIRMARRLFGLKYRRAWRHWERPETLLADSYAHPHERTYAVGEVVRQLRQAGYAIEATTPPLQAAAFWRYLAARDAQGRYLNISRTRLPWAWLARLMLRLSLHPTPSTPADPSWWDRAVLAGFFAYTGLFGYSQGLTVLARRRPMPPEAS